MPDIKSFPMGLPMLGQSHGKVAATILDRMDDEAVHANFANDFELCGGYYGLLDVSAGRREMLGHDVTRPNKLSRLAFLSLELRG